TTGVALADDTARLAEDGDEHGSGVQIDPTIESMLLDVAQCGLLMTSRVHSVAAAAGDQPMIRYDAVVIGSGQAANPLSQKLADQGWPVALIEKEHLGGTCVNTGCTPTKTMVMSAQVEPYPRHQAPRGVRAANVGVDLGSIVARKHRIVERFRSGQQRQVDSRENLHL